MTKPSLRAALKRKARPTVTYAALVGDPAQPAAVLADARQKLRMAAASGDDTAAQLEEVRAAEADLERCWQPIVLQSIPAAAFMSLLAEHPPTKEQKAEAAEWNPETFQPALIAASAVDSGMNAQQWAEELASDRWSTAERNELFGKCLEVNLTTRGQRLASGL